MNCFHFAVMFTDNKSKKRNLVGKFFEKRIQDNKPKFHNKELEKFAQEFNISIGNIHDVTKFDHISKLPSNMLEQNYCIIHIGNGFHKFVKGLDQAYHSFERDIAEENSKNFEIKFGLLDGSDTSEANLLSLAFNRLLVHDFLYEDISQNPNIYLPTRTKTNLSYFIGKESVIAENIQMESDLILENRNKLTIFECKISNENDFAIYQLYHPFLKYYNEKYNGSEIEAINCCYVLRRILASQERNEKPKEIEMYLYTFRKPSHMNSIQLEKAAKYNLIER